MPLGFPLHGIREHACHKDEPGIHAVAGFYPTAITGRADRLDAQSSWHPTTPTPSNGKPETACQTRPRATAMRLWGVQCPWDFLCTAFVNMHATRCRPQIHHSKFTIHHSKGTARSTLCAPLLLLHDQSDLPNLFGHQIGHILGCIIVAFLAGGDLGVRIHLHSG